MAGKVVNLTVHKNTKLERQFRACAESLKQSVATITRAQGTAGFVLLAWNGGGKATLAYDNTAGAVEQEALPDWVHRELLKRL